MPVDGREELVAFGQKPSDLDINAFQGVHSGALLVIFDEANGMPAALWDGGDSLMTNEDCRMLAIGNPDDRLSEFARVCSPGSGWHVIQISAFDTPCFTGEDVPATLLRRLVGRTWVEEKRKRWAPNWTWSEDETRCIPPAGADPQDTHPFWQSKVLGLFPKQADEHTLIPPEWLRAAIGRPLSAGGPVELGVDVGGGGDESTVCLRRGGVARIIFASQNPDTMQTCGTVVALRRQYGATRVKVDKIGLGLGLTQRLAELGEPVVGVHVGEQAENDREFVNRRAELWWALRTLFERSEA
jgi:hypothetical protein